MDHDKITRIKAMIQHPYDYCYIETAGTIFAYSLRIHGNFQQLQLPQHRPPKVIKHKRRGLLGILIAG